MESASKAGFSWPHLKAWNSQLGLLEVHAGLGLGGSTLIIAVTATQGGSKPQGCVRPPAALPWCAGAAGWEPAGICGAGDISTRPLRPRPSVLLSFLPLWECGAGGGGMLPAALPHAGPSPSRGHRREVTLQSVPVNENLLSVSCEPSRGWLLGGVGTDNTGARPEPPFASLPKAHRGPFNLLSAASPLPQALCSRPLLRGATPRGLRARPCVCGPVSAQAAPWAAPNHPGIPEARPLPCPSSCLKPVPKCRGEAAVGPGEVKAAPGRPVDEGEGSAGL